MVGDGLDSRGSVAELEVVETAWGSAVARWQARDGAVRFAVYVDAELYSVIENTECVLGVMASGPHNITVIAIDDQDPPQYRPEWETGDQALVQWTPATGTDIASYNVAVGATTYSAEDIMVQKGTIEKDSGTGTGRLYVGGAYNGQLPCNVAMELEVQSDGTIQYTDDSTMAGDVAEGETLVLRYGATITFLDAATAYDAGDKFTVRLGPTTQYMTPAIASGTYAVTVTSVSSNGTTGTPVAAGNIHVPAPDVAATLSVAEDDDLSEVRIDWEVTGDDAAGIAIYMNWDPTEAVALDLVCDQPVTIMAGTTGSFSVPSLWGVTHTLRIAVAVLTSNDLWVPLTGVTEQVLPIPGEVFGVASIYSVTQSNTTLTMKLLHIAVDGDDTTILRVAWSGDMSGSHDVAYTPAVPGVVGSTDHDIDFPTAFDGCSLAITVTPVSATGSGSASDEWAFSFALAAPASPSAPTAVPA
jgi:hypothetical protein